jgi:GTP-sensing pleiotropic transcriptional regulator CodY
VNENFRFLHIPFDNGCWKNVSKCTILLKNDTLDFVRKYIFFKMTAVIADVVATNVRILNINFIGYLFLVVRNYFESCFQWSFG